MRWLSFQRVRRWNEDRECAPKWTRYSLLLLACVGFCLSAQSFTHAQNGTLIEDVEMPALAGGKQHLLTNDKGNVLVFFKPGQENSGLALKELAELEKQLAGKSVHWVAIVSDRIPRADAESELKEANITMPVLIDVGDALYGRLGVAQVPVTVISDQNHKLVAYEPFRKVNYAVVVGARIRYLLKEINDDELAAVLNPPVAESDTEAAMAHRRLKLAERLFEIKNYDMALESVNISIEKNPKLAAAHALRGDILVAQGKFSDARDAYDQALKLDPKDARSLQGMKTCQENTKH